MGNRLVLRQWTEKSRSNELRDVQVT